MGFAVMCNDFTLTGRALSSLSLIRTLLTRTHTINKFFFCIEFFINLHCQTTVFLLFISFLHLLDCSLIYIPPHNVAISVSWEPCQWYRGWKSVGYSDHCSYRSFVTNAAIQTV